MSEITNMSDVLSCPKCGKVACECGLSILERKDPVFAGLMKTKREAELEVKRIHGELATAQTKLHQAMAAVGTYWRQRGARG